MIGPILIHQSECGSWLILITVVVVTERLKALLLINTSAMNHQDQGRTAVLSPTPSTALSAAQRIY